MTPHSSFPRNKNTEKRAASPVVDTFKNESYQLEAQEGDNEDGLVVLQLGDVGVESVAEQHAVLHDDDEVEQELSDQSGHVLQRLRPRKQEGIHSVKGNKCQITVYVFHQIRCIFMRNFICSRIKLDRNINHKWVNWGERNKG